MSDHIYSADSVTSSQNFVTVAKAVSRNRATGQPHLLTKRNYANGNQISYDNANRFDFFEVEVWNLYDLYRLSLSLLSKPRCCIHRTRIIDHDNRRGVRRLAYADEERGDRATLLSVPMNWFALDIDSYGESTGNLHNDIISVLLALPLGFRNTECFAVASSSYGIKPGIRMRLFFWSSIPISNKDLVRAFTGNEAKVDLALFRNPVQPIYTAAPIFYGKNDPIKQRAYWYTPSGWNYGVTVDCIPAAAVNMPGAPEKRYTKQAANSILNKKLIQIAELAPGERHYWLYEYSRVIGKLIGQDLLDEEETIDRIYSYCDEWTGKRDTRKDYKTIVDGVQRGIKSVNRENEHA